MREPNFPIERHAKLSSLAGNINQKMFIDFFIQEVSLREKRGRTQLVGPTVESKYAKMLTNMAVRIWQASLDLSVNGVNLIFIFLNRYYAFFIKENPLNKMTYYWDEFLIDLRHAPELISLLNYDDTKREMICNIIQEFKEASHAEVFRKFLSEHADGFKVRLPQHDKERSKLFETFLMLLHQLEENKLEYFIHNHAVEILKAHVWGLKKFGDPVHLQLGHLTGDTAMYRLRNYYDTFVKSKQGKKAFGGLHGEEF